MTRLLPFLKSIQDLKEMPFVILCSIFMELSKYGRKCLLFCAGVKREEEIHLIKIRKEARFQCCCSRNWWFWSNAAGGSLKNALCCYSHWPGAEHHRCAGQTCTGTLPTHVSFSFRDYLLTFKSVKTQDRNGWTKGGGHKEERIGAVVSHTLTTHGLLFRLMSQKKQQEVLPHSSLSLPPTSHWGHSIKSSE